MDKIFQIAAQVIKIETKQHGSLKLVFETQENISADAVSRVFEWINKLGWLTFNAHMIDASDIADLPPLKSTGKKSPSQRQREVIWKLWNKDDHGYDSFDDFYIWYMDKLIEKLQDKLT